MSLERQIQQESERFQTLLGRLSDTQWSEAALPKAKSHVEACRSQAHLAQEKIITFNAASEKEHKRLVDMKGHGAKHIWYKVRGKLEHRLEEQERKWLQEFEKYKEEEHHLAVLNEEICSAEKHLHQCQRSYEEFLETKNAAAQSQRFINEAKRVYPKILDIGDLHINQNNLVFNIMFDNIWTDMSMRKMIHEASNRISRADTLLVNILAGMKAKLQECEADRDKTNEVVKQLMAKHFSTRITMVKNIIGPPPPYSS
ncbi:unnamed protein product [Rotaria socialis]|uniref:Uncharacterized protein n=2 Tax=Rotaria socialis TaxID=392032 RepID=A0A820GAY7_9BILA|nr:unnamed protein product [Rotaria socialis]CAF4580629.1 unnamed protein product [Rotaria socialis]